MADQHPVDRGGGQPEAGSDAGRAEPLAPVQPRRSAAQLERRSAWAVDGDAGPVDQASFAELPVAGPPAVGGDAGDAHLVGNVGDQPSRLSRDPPTSVSLPAGVSRALAWAMKPPS
jgi:hypothetical protein